MTYEEALNEINQECVICRTSNSCAKDECIWYICKKAIDKQIPKKPKRLICADGKTYVYHCSGCGAWLTKTIFVKNEFYELGVRANGCHNCLQAIDWSDEE